MLRLIFAFALIGCACAGDSILSQADQQGILDAVNQIRSEVQGTLYELEYSGPLANMANTWTSTCSGAQSPKLRLLFGTTFLTSKNKLTPTELVDVWAAEKSAFKQYTVEETLAAKNYTVLVYENATKMGCAATSCNGGYFYGCVFTPKGNHNGKFPFNYTCKPKTPINCQAKGYCGTYNDGCKQVQCGPACRSNATRSDIHTRDTPNWKDQGYATPIKNQGQCGSCWAFATTEAVETQWAIAGGQLITLSPQQVLDCSNGGSCNGGLPFTAMQFLANGNTKMATESSYPYKGSDQSCGIQGNTAVTGAATPAKRLDNTEDAITQGLAYGPVNVVLNAEVFQSDGGGYISQSCSSNQPDHAVSVYGILTNNGQEYWLIRNHWGTSVGNAGWHWAPKGQNWCGIGSEENVLFYPGPTGGAPPAPTPSPTPTPPTPNPTPSPTPSPPDYPPPTPSPPTPTPTPPYNPTPPYTPPPPSNGYCAQMCQYAPSWCSECCQYYPSDSACGGSSSPTPSPSNTGDNTGSNTGDNTGDNTGSNTGDYSPPNDYSGDYTANGGGNWNGDYKK